MPFWFILLLNVKPEEYPGFDLEKPLPFPDIPSGIQGLCFDYSVSFE